MKTLTVILLISLFSAFSINGNASEKKNARKKSREVASEEKERKGVKRKKSLHDEVSGVGYGLAGCGLGNVFFGKESQVMAATTNGSSGTQTFGIISGTSNCVDAKGNAKLESYIEANSVALANDISRGQGETLVGLTQVLQCFYPSEVHGLLKSNYSEIYKNGMEDFTSVTHEVRTILQSHREASEGCNG